MCVIAGVGKGREDFWTKLLHCWPDSLAFPIRDRQTDGRTDGPGRSLMNLYSFLVYVHIDLSASPSTRIYEFQ